MAAGNSLINFEATAFYPLANQGARFGTRAGWRPVWIFDGLAIRGVYMAGIMPRQYSGGGITLRILWTAATATTGQTQWYVSVERHDPATDLDADSFAPNHTIVSNANAVSGAPVYGQVNLQTSNLDGLVAGDHFRILIQRAADGAMVGDAELHAVALSQT